MPLVWVLRPTAGSLFLAALSKCLTDPCAGCLARHRRSLASLALPVQGKSCLGTARASRAEASRGDVEGSGGRPELAETLEPARLNARLL